MTSQAPWTDATAATRSGNARASAITSPPLMQNPTAPTGPSEAAAGSSAATASNASASPMMFWRVTVPISSLRWCMSSSLIPNSRNGPPR